MKKLTLSSLFLSLFISYIIMIQSCAVYTRPVTLEKAIGKGPVKIVTSDEKSLKFNSLIMDNGQVFGVKRTGASIKYQQIPDNIHYVQLKDREASTILTVAAVAGGIGLIVIPTMILNSISENMDFSGFSSGSWCINPRDHQPDLIK